MKITEQIEKARTFQKLHKEKRMFVIPNSWDAGSAFVYEKQGFSCVATSSAGVAYALGYPDGEGITLDDLAQVVAHIVRRVDIPVSADFERGYAEEPEKVKENARRLLNAGAVGFNIEDGVPEGAPGEKLSPLELQLDKIRALVELKEESGVDFVINARTCAYWLNVGSAEEMFEIAVERGNAFRRAGADCVFVPGAIDEATVTMLVNAINAPLNTILSGKFHDFRKLDEIGVRRLSVGSGPARCMCEQMIRLADDLRNENPARILSCAFGYDDANAYFKKTKDA